MRKIILTIAIALGLASCASTQKTEVSGEWKVQTINGNALPSTMHEPELNINADKTFTGITGVNQMSGTYTLNDNSIHFNDGPMTKMAADPESMEVETNYLKAIFSAKTVANENGNLILKDADGKELMKLSKKK